MAPLSIASVDLLDSVTPERTAPRHSAGSRLQQSDVFHQYQLSFESLTGLPLVWRDPGSLRTPMQGSRQANPFCTMMTQTNHSCAACLRLQQRVEDEASLTSKTLQCHAGLNESAVPVRVGDKLLGYLQTGQVLFRAPSQRGFEAIQRLVGPEDPRLDQRELAAAYFKTRVVARTEYDSVIHLLTLFAQHLALISNQSVRSDTTVESPSITKGRTFIAQHQSEEMRLDDVAGAANMSKFYFCKLFKQATGFSFTEYLARARVDSVKRLLRNAQIRVSEAAFAAGFQSLSQFNRVFRRFAGEAPSTFRDRIRRSSEDRPGPATAPRQLALERRRSEVGAPGWPVSGGRSPVEACALRDGDDRDN